MRRYWLVLIAMLLVVPFAMTAMAQDVVEDVGVGPALVPAPLVYGPPVCAWGYYPYYPYACAPYGYYGPGWFYNGIFIGVGPWYGWGWGWHHGWYGGYPRHGGYPIRGGVGVRGVGVRGVPAAHGAYTGGYRGNAVRGYSGGTRGYSGGTRGYSGGVRGGTSGGHVSSGHVGGFSGGGHGGGFSGGGSHGGGGHR